MSDKQHRFRRFCAWVVGIVFTGSGALKLMDPTGAGLVMDEYFKFLHLGFLSVLSKPAGIAFALAETVTGIALVTGVWRKLTAVACSLLMALFTILTILLVAFNPEMDCGCFGEIAHLTHWQSLLKNIVIDFLLVIAFVPAKNLGTPKKKKYVTFVTVTAAMVAFLVYSLAHLPLKDFTDYAPGKKLLSALDENENVMFKASFVYEKNGMRKSFTLEEELPDSSWTFIRSEAIPNKDLKDMPVLPVTENGEISDSLAAQGNVMIVSLYKPQSLDAKEKAAAHDFLAQAEAAGFRPLLLSTTPEIALGEYQSDYRALIGLNRSNGGATLIQDGIIIKKWSRIAPPTFEEMEELYQGEALDTLMDSESNGALAFQAFMLGCFALLLLL